MSKYTLMFTKQALKDIQSLTPKLKKKLRQILVEVIAESPLEGKRLSGELHGNFSYRLSLKDRIVYSIDEKQKTVFVKRARTHYGE